MPGAENSSQSPVPAEPVESTGVTPIDTERLRALLAASTPGPWTVMSERRPHWISFPEGVTADVDEADWGGDGHDMYQLVSVRDPRAWSYADTRLVAEAVTTLPALLDEVDRLRDGLLTIVNGHQCEAYTGRPYCRDEGSGKQRDARYGADRWCDTCIALDALASAATPDPEGAGE